MPNEDKLAGAGREVVGRVEQAAGDLTGNVSLKADGLADQIGGNLSQLLGSARDLIGAGVDRLPEGARRFVRQRPVASAAIAGVAALALFKFLRPAS